jgi:DDE_Tnp_1-associated
MTLLEALNTIPDHRGKHGRMYDLPHILLFAIIASTCGSIGYSDIAVFIQKRFKLLQKYFNLTWRQSPTHSTIHKIISEVKPTELEKAFRLFSKHLSKSLEENTKARDTGKDDNNQKRKVLAIDGKVLKNSYDSASLDNQRSGTNSKPSGLISVMNSNDLIILAHVDIRDKDSELVSTQELITELSKDHDFQGFVITADALHTQKKLSRVLE